MRTSARCAALLTALAASGCAGMIKPKYINPRVYSELSCDQIRAEDTQTRTLLKQFAAYEKSAGWRNAGSLLLFGFPAPLVGVYPSEIASLKGRLIALQTVATDKQCGALE